MALETGKCVLAKLFQHFKINVLIIKCSHFCGGTCFHVCTVCVADSCEKREKLSKIPRVVHYDSTEVQKYMRKRREQQRQKRREELESVANAKAAKERKLQELMQRQQQTAAASAAATRRKMARLQQVGSVVYAVSTFKHHFTAYLSDPVKIFNAFLEDYWYAVVADLMYLLISLSLSVNFIDRNLQMLCAAPCAFLRYVTSVILDSL